MLQLLLMVLLRLWCSIIVPLPVHYNYYYLLTFDVMWSSRVWTHLHLVRRQ